MQNHIANRREYYLDNSDYSIDICTLSNIIYSKILQILNHISIVERLSENNGIDSIIEYVHKNQKTDTI
ncbi:MAG: hypothetical protein OEY17_04035 [Nitrosopumilus sp.]|nr:hypothetical protein [Nitrosopumilus sp.]